MFCISAKIDRPWKFDPKTKRPITVNEVIDTNMLQYARGPSDSKNKEVGCLCCKGPLHLDGNILWFLFISYPYLIREIFLENNNGHCVKSFRIRSFSGLYFPAFGLHTEIYSVFIPNAGK